MGRAGLALILLLATPAFADAPDRSPRPITREAAARQEAQALARGVAGAGAAAARSLGALFPAGRRAREGSVAAPGGVALSPRPEERPEDLAAARVPGPLGAICGDPMLHGRNVAPIPGRLRGCGIAAPVELREVAGVTLSHPALIDCVTARALKRWVVGDLMPALGRRGGGVAELGVAAHYSCRTRNSQPGARISEHAKGRAIDIAAIRLQDGTQITVLEGWEDDAEGPVLRRLHDAACGTFGTVLGPESDQFHQDHFHFDTARYRSGSYCR